MKSYQFIDAIFTETMEAKQKEATARKKLHYLNVAVVIVVVRFSVVPSFPFVFDSTKAIKRFQ